MSTTQDTIAAKIVAEASSSGIPYWIGIGTSWLCFGALFVQVTIFFQQRRRIGRAQLFALLVILCLATANALINVARVIELFVYHLTDVAYLSTSFHRPIVVVGFYVSISLILCCQTFLLRRSFLFGQTFHLGNSKWRLAYLGLIACLVIVGACLGFVAQKELLDFKTLDDVIVRTREFQSEGLYETSQGIWLGMALAVDVLLTIIISKDLLSAISFNKNDVSVGITLRRVLLRLLRLTITNGAILVALQVAILAAYATTSTGWAVGGLAALPSLQTVSLLSYLCSPHLKVADERSADDEVDLERSSGLPQRSVPTTARSDMTMVEKGRRKLPALARVGRGKTTRAWKVLVRPVGLGVTVGRIPSSQIPTKAG